MNEIMSCQTRINVEEFKHIYVSSFKKKVQIHQEKNIQSDQRYVCENGDTIIAHYYSSCSAMHKDAQVYMQNFSAFECSIDLGCGHQPQVQISQLYDVEQVRFLLFLCLSQTGTMRTLAGPLVDSDSSHLTCVCFTLCFTFVSLVFVCFSCECVFFVFLSCEPECGAGVVKAAKHGGSREVRGCGKGDVFIGHWWRSTRFHVRANRRLTWLVELRRHECQHH